MNTQKQPSSIDFLKGKMTFTDEPLYYRVIVMIFVAAFLAVICIIIKQWAFPIIARQWLNFSPGIWIKGKQ